MQDDDQTWMGADDENYTIAEPDRTVSKMFICLQTLLFISEYHCVSFLLYIW